ncbi:glycosyl transferase, family 1, partial [Haematococcus lacustris]
VEAMAMGLPVIATNASGVTAYLDAQVGYPVPFTLVPVPEGSRWAEPDVTSLQVLMGTVVDNPAEAQRRGQAARQRMLHRYSPAVVAGQLWAQFQRINAQLDRGRSP